MLTEKRGCVSDLYTVFRSGSRRISLDSSVAHAELALVSDSRLGRRATKSEVFVMDRRKFIKNTVATLGVLAAQKSIAAECFKAQSTDSTNKIGYIRAHAPSFQIPGYRGDPY